MNPHAPRRERARPAQARFYFDADVLGVAKVVAALRSDVTYPGDSGAMIHRRIRPPCPIRDPATSDRLWIPEVPERDWLIITRDSRIQDHRAEIAAVTEYAAKMVALTGKHARNTWQQLEVVMCQWRRFDELAGTPGPFIWRATRTTLGRVRLD
jgi:hypothetical protein